MSLQGKKIILAITGSIAAYKTPQLVRLLVKAGAEVQVLMTEAAGDFVTPLVLSTVSGKPVFSAVREAGHWNNHVHLGRWADVLVVAPCSANTLAKMAQGICDNMVLAVYLSATSPVILVPAMDEDMWRHPATRANIERLESFGNICMPVAHGELASGLIGEGRMAEPEAIRDFIVHFLPGQQGQAGKRALVTAGPTFEAIDPVRFIGNHSSGKMGVALAEALAGKGYAVDLVMGPGTVAAACHPLIRVHRVTSAQEMLAACEQLFPEAQVAVMAAAVADYRPKEVAAKKIKKGAEAAFNLTLVKNPDILAHLGKIKKPGQTLIGFALETDDALENARKKLEEKHADMIVLNSLQDEGAGFGRDTNKVTVLRADGTMIPFALKTKKEIAGDIIDCIPA